MPESPISIYAPPKKTKQYLTSGLTVAEYKRLPYNEQRRVTEECTRGLVYKTVADPLSGRAMLVGQKPKP